MEEPSPNWDTFYVSSDLTYERYMKNMKNKEAFDAFRKANLNNPEFRGKFVAFIDCKFAGVDEKRCPLLLRLREKFGSVDMHLSQITDKELLLDLNTMNFVENKISSQSN